MMLSSSGAALAQSVLPQGGNVVSGQARIAPALANQLSITQNSSRAIVDWNSFSVGSAGSVSFIQPNSSSAILNRVTGSASSSIAGAITGNGQVFLVNPNGIAITPTGTVRVGGGFVGSTLDISDADFNASHLSFAGTGASAGVRNAGSISTATGGFVGLIGGTVSNSGTIRVPLGKVGLGSGEQATLDPTGDGFLQVAVPTGTVAANGQALVDVSGHVTAAGGRIEIKAATARQAVRDAVNVTGALSAQSVSGRKGSIVLGGGDGGTIAVSGKLSATGGRRAQGGSVTVTGGNIALRGALVDVSGGTGGGTVEIGGGPHGSGPLPHAATTSVDNGSLIKADATINGNGGHVTVWSDQATTFAGHISARGGAAGGNGGEAEVSGKAQLSLTGDYSQTPLADLTALRGTTGTLLFDPGTVNIINQTSLANQSALNGPDNFTAQFIAGQLASANVTIDTNNATGANGANGDINLMSNALITWSSANSLTLNAARNINFAAGASIAGSGAGAGLVLRADSGGSGIGTLNFFGGTQVNLPSGSVNLYYNPASNRTVANGGTNNAAGTVNATSYTGTPAAETWSSFINAGTLTPWMLVNNIYDLQNINNNLTANYALGTNIDASATSGWNAGAGFVPLGNGSNGFAGSFDGSGHTIDGLTINRSGVGYVALFGDLGGTAITQNIGLTNVAVTGGGPFTGALAGFAAAGSLISNSYSTGSVGGVNWVGGLVGRSQGTISSSYSTAAVAGTSRLGGLAGQSDGTLSQSYATGAVSSAASGFYVGGLAGYNSGNILSSYATGSVTGGGGSNEVGGLVGLNNGTISTTWSSGATSGGSVVGGLVGLNAHTILSSYYDNQASGQGSGVGSGPSAGVTGLTTSQALTQSSYAGWDFAANWWMQDGLTRPFLQSEYSTTIVNAHQLQLINLSSVTLSASYTLRANVDASIANGSAPSGMWSSSGFVPLGTDGAGTVLNANQGFTGSFNGAAHSIDQLTISQAANGFFYGNGLFGVLGTGASVSNVGLTNASINATINTGALVGLNNGGVISNAFSNGTVTGNRSVGGLVGNNNQSTGLIRDSYSSAQVTGTVEYVGGLVGVQDNSASIANSYASGQVIGAGADQVGGLIGNNSSGSITNSYASGPVNGATNVGGFVGANAGSISSSLSTGVVTASSSPAGGFAGSNSGTITQSYFDSSIAGQVSGVGSGVGGVTGLATATLQDGSPPAGFTAANWTASAGSYPGLAPAAPGLISFTAVDSNAGSVVYGSAAPGFGYAVIVTDGHGNTLCSANCSAYFSGTPLIDTLYSSNSLAGSSTPGYIAQGTVAPQSGYAVQYLNDPLTVAARSLTITASNQSKTYGAAAALGTAAFTATGLVNGDVVSSATLSSPGAAAAANAGSYNILPSAAVGTGLSNYTISYADTGQLTVNPAPVSLTVLGGSSTYGSSPSNPGLSATGLQNGQNVSALTGLRNSFGIIATSNAGSYMLDVAGTLTNANYTVVGTNSGSWTVNPAPVSVAALSGSSAYGSSPTNPGLAATGLQNGQNVSALTGLRNSFDVTSSSSAGSYTLRVAGTLSNPNYVLASAMPGIWTVTPPLRSSLDSTSSPSIPGLLIVAPIAIGNGGTLDWLEIAASRVKLRTPASVRPTAAAAPRAKLNPVAPRPTTTSPSPANPISIPATTPAPEPALRGAVTAAPMMKAPCSNGDCGSAAPNQPRRLTDFALSYLNRVALTKALGEDYDDITGGIGTLRAALWTAFGVSGLGLSAGFVGWLLRRGALLSALLASMPVWRGFDPMMVLMQRPNSPDAKKPDDRDEPPSDADRLFDAQGSLTAVGSSP